MAATMAWMWMDSITRITHAVLVASMSALAALSVTSVNRNDVCGAQVETRQQVTHQQTDRLRWLSKRVGIWDWVIGNISDNLGYYNGVHTRAQQGDTICMGCWDSIINGHFRTDYIGS